MDVVQNQRIGKVAVEGEISRDVLGTHRVDQLLDQFGVVAEGFLAFLTLLLFAKAAKVQWIMLAAGADVIGEDVVVRNLVALLGMVPEPTGILDQFPIVVDQDIVDGNDAVVAVVGRGIFLEPLQALLIEFLDIPIDFGEKPVETRLVGGVGKFPVDSQDGLALGDQQAREVLGEVPPLRFAAEEVAEVTEGILHHLRKFNDSRHKRPLGRLTAPAAITQIMYKSAHFYTAA